MLLRRFLLMCDAKRGRLGLPPTLLSKDDLLCRGVVRMVHIALAASECGKAAAPRAAAVCGCSLLPYDLVILGRLEAAQSLGDGEAFHTRVTEPVVAV